MRTVLRAAGVYNLAWGAWAILFPAAFWSLLDMPAPNYPFLWQCIGMIVGVYGVGYWIAASNPARHWPIVLVGLLGKIFGPIGFLQAWLIDHAVPAKFGLTILTNDILWWIPFVLILAHAYRVAEAQRDLIDHAPDQIDLRGALQAAKTNDGRSLAEISESGPALVVFLRHAGCTFCRETLADLQRQRAAVFASGVTPVLVHMGTDAQASGFFAKYNLADVPRISDPDRQLYRAFQLRRGKLAELFGPRVWIRGFVAGVMNRHGVGAMVGDGFQMPGAFIVHRGRIVRAFRHRDASDRPDYERLTEGACAI